MTTGEHPDELFEKFVSAYGHGENPDVREYLERAGVSRSELGALIDSFLAFAPIGETDEETVILVNARIAGRTPIEEARVARSLSVGSVVERLRERLNLGTGLTDRLREAYRDLERDWLDPRGVDQSVWDALHAIIGIDAQRLAAGEPDHVGVLMRSEKAPMRAQVAPSEQTGKAPDEVDRLFRQPPSDDS